MSLNLRDLAFTVEYVQGADLPDLVFPWHARAADGTPTVINWTLYDQWELKLGDPGTAAVLTKTTGISGDALSVVTIAWATSGELNTLPVGRYTAQLQARRTADQKHRVMFFELAVAARIS